MGSILNTVQEKASGLVDKAGDAFNNMGLIELSGKDRSDAGAAFAANDASEEHPDIDSAFATGAENTIGNLTRIFNEDTGKYDYFKKKTTGEKLSAFAEAAEGLSPEPSRDVARSGSLRPVQIPQGRTGYNPTQELRGSLQRLGNAAGYNQTAQELARIEQGMQIRKPSYNTLV